MTRHIGTRRSTAGDDHNTRRRLTGVARDGAIEGGLRRGLALRGAGGVAHPLVAATGAGVACSGGGGELGGGRSSADNGLGDAEQGRSRG